MNTVKIGDYRITYYHASGLPLLFPVHTATSIVEAVLKAYDYVANGTPDDKDTKPSSYTIDRRLVNSTQSDSRF